MAKLAMKIPRTYFVALFGREKRPGNEFDEFSVNGNGSTSVGGSEFQ